jgi:hypothetical protein
VKYKGTAVNITLVVDGVTISLGPGEWEAERTEAVCDCHAYGNEIVPHNDWCATKQKNRVDHVVLKPTSQGLIQRPKHPMYGGLGFGPVPLTKWTCRRCLTFGHRVPTDSPIDQRPCPHRRCEGPHDWIKEL